MKIVMIEDEMPAAERLVKLISRLQPEAEVLVILDSIKKTVEWLSHNSDYDLVFMDIHLADGLSFNIFKKVKIDETAKMEPLVF